MIALLSAIIPVAAILLACDKYAEVGPHHAAELGHGATAPAGAAE